MPPELIQQNQDQQALDQQNLVTQFPEQTLEIRDIHLPDPVSWWPLAAGWWLLLLGIIALIWLSIWLWRRRVKLRSSGKFLAQQELIKLEQEYQVSKDHSQLTKDISILLRRTCVSVFPREDCAGLTGDNWLTFLDSKSTQKGFKTALGQALIAAPYTDSVAAETIADDLIKLCKNWLKGLP